MVRCSDPCVVELHFRIRGCVQNVQAKEHAHAEQSEESASAQVRISLPEVQMHCAHCHRKPTDLICSGGFSAHGTTDLRLLIQFRYTTETVFAFQFVVTTIVL